MSPTLRQPLHSASLLRTLPLSALWDLLSMTFNKKLFFKVTDADIGRSGVKYRAFARCIISRVVRRTGSGDVESALLAVNPVSARRSLSSQDTLDAVSHCRLPDPSSNASSLCATSIQFVTLTLILEECSVEQLVY